MIVSALREFGKQLIGQAHAAGVTIVFRTAIAIRAYSEDPDRDPVGLRPPSPDGDASPWTLVFDC